MKRRTIVVEGPLAFRMRRIVAVRRAEVGIQIMTLPQLAARLAGGFVRPARSHDLDPAIRTALEAGGFSDLESIRELPGMTRSVAWTLTRVWDADFSLANRADGSARLLDLARIESDVRTHLPPGVLTPRDLRDLALQRVGLAPSVLGDVELDRVVRVAPVWRPLLEALARYVRLVWRDPGTADVTWFPGEVDAEARAEPAAPDIVSCAAPRTEVVEALRWLRELVSSGRVLPEEVAICATTTDDWDNDMLVVATDAGLPLHFSHGVPALASREGQACAALADVLLNGLSQDRVRRLLGHAAGRSQGLDDLPPTWAQDLQPEPRFSSSINGAARLMRPIPAAPTGWMFAPCCFRSSNVLPKDQKLPSRLAGCCSAMPRERCGPRRSVARRRRHSNFRCRNCAFLTAVIPAPVPFGVPQAISPLHHAPGSACWA